MNFKKMREYSHEEFVELVQSLSEEELLELVNKFGGTPNLFTNITTAIKEKNEEKTDAIILKINDVLYSSSHFINIQIDLKYSFILFPPIHLE